MDNTRSVWTLNPKNFARFIKSESDHEKLSHGIKTNWFLDKLIDYQPDHLFFYKMDPRIFSSNEFKQEMHEMILSLLERPIHETVKLIKNHFPQHLFVDKEPDSDAESSSVDSDDEPSSDEKELPGHMIEC